MKVRFEVAVAMVVFGEYNQLSEGQEQSPVIGDFSSRARQRPLAYLKYTVSALHSDEDEEKWLM